MGTDAIFACPAASMRGYWTGLAAHGFPARPLAVAGAALAGAETDFAAVHRCAFWNQAG